MATQTSNKPTQQHIKNEYLDLSVEYLPCSKTHPGKYHSLDCTHIVSTPEIAPCGPNCFGKGLLPPFYCHVCADRELFRSRSSSTQSQTPKPVAPLEYRDTTPAEGEEWVAIFYAEHPEAFEDPNRKKWKPHRLGQGFWQLQEIHRTLKGNKALVGGMGEECEEEWVGWKEEERGEERVDC